MRNELSPDGRWADDELLSTAAEFPGVGSDVDLAEVDRFRAAIARLVAKCSQNMDSDTDSGPAVFLLEPDGPPERFAAQCVRVPMMDRGREPIVSRVWFVTHVATSGSWMPACFETDDELFRLVTDELDLGSVPAILFDPRDPAPELRYYPVGLNVAEEVEVLEMANSQISLDAIFATIDRIHENSLATPGSQSRGAKLWADPRKGTTVKNAEDIVSALLQVGLHTRFPTCVVRVEQPQSTGRLDIEIEERVGDQPGTIRRHAILELKILRGRNPNGTRVGPSRTSEAIFNGVVQAAAYRSDKSALASALCCFDMHRDVAGEERFADVADKARDLQVVLRCWHLFHSSRAYRSFLDQSGSLASNQQDAA